MFSISLSPPLQSHFTEDPRGFEALMKVEGEAFREVKSRRTVRFERGGRRYFIKAHRGPGWGECFKNLMSLNWPVWGAQQEWRGVDAFEKAGVSTMTLAGKGERGWLPGFGQSFVVTEAFEDSMSLEELLEEQERLGERQRNRLKRFLIPQLAEIARSLHENGLNHRDFYLCHFLTERRDWTAWRPPERIELVVIDLHRVQQRSGPTPARWRIKDLGALMFSAFDADLTVSDALRFIRAYHGGREGDWKARYREARGFWFRVAARALSFQREWDRKELKRAMAKL